MTQRKIGLIERAKAAEATMKRFGGRPLTWGSEDCARMVAHCLRQLGHAPPLREAGTYRSLLGAHKALKRMGHASLVDWVDTWGLIRKPPAMALTGDVLAYPTDDPALPALALQISNGRIFGFEPALGACAPVAVFPDSPPPIAAWSV